MSGLYLLDTNVVLALVRGKALGAFIDSTFGLSTGKRRPANQRRHPRRGSCSREQEWGHGAFDLESTEASGEEGASPEDEASAVSIVAFISFRR